jgi:hypothetical protein
VSLGATQPWGKIVTLITFSTKDNYHTENVTFDVADIPLPYNGILGRPALAKFMAASHYAYNTLKMPASWGVLTVRANVKDVVLCIEQMFKMAVAATRGSAREDLRESSGPRAKKIHASPELVPGGSIAMGPVPRKKQLKGEPQLTKKVPVDGDMTRSINIGANLSPQMGKRARHLPPGELRCVRLRAIGSPRGPQGGD